MRLFGAVPATVVFRLLDRRASWWDLARIMAGTIGWGLGLTALRRALPPARQ